MRARAEPRSGRRPRRFAGRERWRPALSLLAACLPCAVAFGASCRTPAGHETGGGVVEAPAPGEAVMVVPAGERVEVSDLVVEAEDGRIAVRVWGTLVAEGLAVRGGSVALRVEEGAVVSLADADVRGAGIEVRGGTLLVDGLTVREVEGPALFVSSGRLEGSSILAESVEHGLLARPEAVVRLSDLTVRGALFAGVALTGSDTEVDGLLVEGPSRHGAVLAGDLEVPLRLSNASFIDVGPVGLSLLRAPAVVDGLKIDGVARAPRGEEGMGLLAVASRLRVSALRISGCEGEGVAGLRSELRLEGGRIEGSGAPGVMGWDESRIAILDVTVEGGRDLGLAAAEGSRLVMRSGVLSGNAGGAAAADCDTGSSIVLKEVASEGPLGSCVRSDP